MDTRHPVLGPGDVEAAMCQVNLLPTQGSQFGRSEAMSVGQQDHGRITVTMAVGTGCLHQPFDLVLGQVLSGPILGVRQTTTRDCSLYSGWGVVMPGRIHRAKSAVFLHDSSYNSY